MSTLANDYLPILDFGPKEDPQIGPQGSLKGIIAAAYSLGAILSLPLIPWVNDRFGRRMSIFMGSLIMVVGAIVQGFAQHGESYSYNCMVDRQPRSSC